jgi:hypothetical protein
MSPMLSVLVAELQRLERNQPLKMVAVAQWVKEANDGGAHEAPLFPVKAHRPPARRAPIWGWRGRNS